MLGRRRLAAAGRRWPDAAAITAALIAALVATGGVQARQAVSPPASGQVLRAAVHAVPIFATVTDAHGVLVPDLEQEDFVVTDEGKRQTLTVFMSDVQPVPLAILVDVSPSVYQQTARIHDAVASSAAHLFG